MTTIVVSNSAPFGQISNTMVRNVVLVDSYVKRLEAATSNAAAGFSGTAGTEYETGTPSGNQFGVLPSSTPGEQGASYRFAVDTINTAWATFMASAQGALTALDNGNT